MLFLMANHGSSRVKCEHELIVNTSGTVVVEYTYDAWGRLLTTTGSMASTLGEINPLRYRGYVYDTETGLYYLQSRYYNPAIGRFINADSYAATGQGLLGNNMFAYCNNSVVNLKDSSGTNATEAITLSYPAWVAFAAWLEGIAASQWWNCVGWVAAGILAIGAITAAGYFLYEWYLSETQSAGHEEVFDEPSPPSPPEDDDDDDYYEDERNFGGKTKIGKQNGNTPQNNQRQNEQVRTIRKKYKKISSTDS